MKKITIHPNNTNMKNKKHNEYPIRVNVMLT